MAKLTLKTTKEGQKCVLTTKTPLFHNYKKNYLDKEYRNEYALKKLESLDNIAYYVMDDDFGKIPINTNKKLIKDVYSDGNGSVYVNQVIGAITIQEGALNHISPTLLKDMKKDCDASKLLTKVGEIKPIITLEKGTEIEISNKVHWGQLNGSYLDYVNLDFDHYLKLKIISGEHKGKEFISQAKSIQGRLDTAHFEDLSAEQNAKPKYKIFYKGEPYKVPGERYDSDTHSYKPTKGTAKTFGDLGKVKASLMDKIGYLDKVYQLNRHFKDISPEVGYQAPEWIGGSAQFSRNDMKHVQVFEWANRKKGKEADFNAVEYYDSLMDFVKVTAQYGSAVRELYKKYKEDDKYKYILLFRHEDYALTDEEYIQKYGGNYRYYDDYTQLKESETIKATMKASKVKGTKKCTKNGKTAIAFPSESDLMKVIKRLDPKDYYVMNIMGEELVEQSGHFIINSSRMKKLERVFMEEFADDFETEESN